MRNSDGRREFWRSRFLFVFSESFFSFSFLLNLHVSVGRGGREGCRTLARCTKFTGIGGGDAQLDSPLGSVASVCFLPAFIVTSLCSSSRVPLPEKGQVTSLLVLKQN